MPLGACGNMASPDETRYPTCPSCNTWTYTYPIGLEGISPLGENLYQDSAIFACHLCGDTFVDGEKVPLFVLPGLDLEAQLQAIEEDANHGESTGASSQRTHLRHVGDASGRLAVGEIREIAGENDVPRAK